MSVACLSTPNLQPAPQPVLFDVRFGDVARQTGAVYDIDMRELCRGTTAAGASAQDVAQCPVLIKPVMYNIEDYYGFAAAQFTPENRLNNGGPAITYFIDPAKNELSTRKVAHESKHLVDWMYDRDSAYVPDRIKLLRKIGVTVGALAVGAAMCIGMQLLPHSHAGGWVNMIPYATSLAATDLLLTWGLRLERSTRTEERRAVATEKLLDDGNALVVQPATAKLEPRFIEQAKYLGATVYQTFVPMFRL